MTPSSPTSPPAGSRPIRVLLLDDDPLVRRYIERQLRGAAHDVTSVGTLREARQELAKSTYGVVVTDMYMPDADGLDILRMVRTEYPAVPVLIISGRFGADVFSKSLMTTARQLGAAEVLAKPVPREDLLSTITRLVSARPVD